MSSSLITPPSLVLFGGGRKHPVQYSTHSSQRYHHPLPNRYTLQGSWLALVLVSLDIIPPLRSLLQLVPLPATGSFRSKLLAVLFLNLGGAFAVEQVARWAQ